MSQFKPGDIEEIIRQFEVSNLATMEVRLGDSQLFLSRHPGLRPSWSVHDPLPAAPAIRASEPAVAAPATEGAAAPPKLEVPPGHVVVTAPSMGTFYRAEKPGAPPYVEVGQEVTPESELGLVEVMKLFTTVRAGVRGRVARILAGDATAIDIGQPLFLIELHD